MHGLFPAIRSALVRALVALLLVSPPLLGQRPEPHAVAAELRGARDGRILAASRGETLDARVLRVGDDSVTLRLGAANRTVALEAIDALWVRVPSTRHGVIGGVIFGGLAGALGGIFFTGAFCDAASGCGGEMVKGAIGGAVLLAVPSALLGGAIGRRATHWQQVVP